MIMATASVKLVDEKIAYVMVAPGMCRTRFIGGQGRKEVSDGRYLILRVASKEARGGTEWYIHFR
jgi:hypothetical protein